VLSKNLGGIIGGTQIGLGPKWLAWLLGDLIMESLTPSVNAPLV
jgi:hypothetical protein